MPTPSKPEKRTIINQSYYKRRKAKYEIAIHALREIGGASNLETAQDIAKTAFKHIGLLTKVTRQSGWNSEEVDRGRLVIAEIYNEVGEEIRTAEAESLRSQTGEI